MSLIGSTIAGKYRVKRLIGQGGMGAVYEGEYIDIGKRVAIKVIDPARAGSAEVAARFKREARAASAVESDCIIHIFDIGEDPDAGLYMVMELLEGEDLASRLDRESHLDVATALAIGVEASRALAKAHAAGVIHRDLKPENLFLTRREDGSLHVKILDFGISKLVRPEGGSTTTLPRGTKALTREGSVIGTPQYMSPEQAQGLAIDARTDVWSLGAVLYEALSGMSAYPQLSTYEQTIIRIVTCRPKPLAEVAPHLPRGLTDAIDATLTHDLTARLPDCGELARRLSNVQAHPPEESGVLRVPASAAAAGRRGPMPAAEPAYSNNAHPRSGRVPPQGTAGGIAVSPSVILPRSPAPRTIVIGSVGVAALALVGVLVFTHKPQVAPPPPPIGGYAAAVIPPAPPPPAPAPPETASATAIVVAPAPMPSASTTAAVPSIAPRGRTPSHVGGGPRRPAEDPSSGQIGGAGLSKDY